MDLLSPLYFSYTLITMSHMEGVQHLKVPLEAIKRATNNFNDETNFIARGGFGKVYIGELVLFGKQTKVAVKRLDRTCGQGDREFLMEIQMLSCYRHENLISLIGFCDEGEENLLVYEHAKHGSLDKYLSDYSRLSWVQRLQISLGAARALSYLHNDVGPQHRVLHRDIKSSNILLNDNWEAKISDFGLSKIGPSNVQYTFLVTSACGTFGYVDPQYLKSGILTKESDVYSFGVVLFQILCGRVALVEKYEDERRFLASLAQLHYKGNKLVFHPTLLYQMKVDSLNLFSEVAYQCLNENRRERPTMGLIAETLEKALELQVSSQQSSKGVGFIQVGTWGRQSGDPQNHWSFELQENHKLVKIAIDHGEVIYPLMFTGKYRGHFVKSDKAGGLAGGDTVSEVTFDDDEQVIGIIGTTGTRDGYTVISSLSFKTNKRTHGPFGQETETPFSIPWDRGTLVGFYGLGGDYIDAIGVYLKAYKNVIRVGTWGKTEFVRNTWSFEVKGNVRLQKITIVHDDVIYSLMFTTLFRGEIHTSKTVGGWNSRGAVSEVNFNWNEEINAMSGTFMSLRGNDDHGNTIISSISFTTNKRDYGPYGHVQGTPFKVEWNDGLFAGFYGLSGYYIDTIGVYLNASRPK